MKYLDKEHETAMRLYKQGYNDIMIAEAMYVSITTVATWRKRNGLGRNYFVRRRKINTPENIEKIRKLKNLGKTDQEIGRLLGINKYTVLAYRKQEGIEILWKQGFKRCKTCNNVYPATLEFFYSKGQGRLQPECKTCRKVTNNRKHQKQKARKQA